MPGRYACGVLVAAVALLCCKQGSELEAQLNGQYVEKFQIQKVSESPTGPQQPLSLRFQASGMAKVRQFEVVVALEPVEAFDLASATFAPEKPFTTVGPGVETTPEKNLRSIGILLDVAGRSGDGGLGTLNLHTSAAFSAATQARVRVVLFSIGPSSRERNTYAEKDLNLGMAVGP